MAFNPANLAPEYYLAETPGLPLVWSYSTSDDVGDIGSSYFADAYRTLRLGDLIQVTAADGKFLAVVSTVNILAGSPTLTIGIIAYGVTNF